MITIRDALAGKAPKVGNVLFIAVDGHGGSGKSTLADWLSKELDAEVIHTDDFASWDNPLDWWQAVVKNVFTPIKEGVKTLTYLRSKWWENHTPEPVTNQRVTKIMILEGVSSLRKEFREYMSLGIFVDTPREICLQRGIKRDSINKTPEEVTKMWHDWFSEEDEYIKRDDPQSYADIVIDGTQLLEDQIR